jgi:hypothetical protein
MQFRTENDRASNTRRRSFLSLQDLSKQPRFMCIRFVKSSLWSGMKNWSCENIRKGVCLVLTFFLCPPHELSLDFKPWSSSNWYHWASDWIDPLWNCLFTTTASSENSKREVIIDRRSKTILSISFNKFEPSSQFSRFNFRWLWR